VSVLSSIPSSGFNIARVVVDIGIMVHRLSSNGSAFWSVQLLVVVGQLLVVVLHVVLMFIFNSSLYKKKVFRCCRVCDGGCQDACNALDLIFVIVFSFGFVCGDSVIAVCSVQQFVELVRVPPVYTAQNFRVPFLEPPRGPTI
jgi:hypothetical protein